jgi:hypothetical protein
MNAACAIALAAGGRKVMVMAGRASPASTPPMLLELLVAGWLGETQPYNQDH